MKYGVSGGAHRETEGEKKELHEMTHTSTQTHTHTEARLFQCKSVNPYYLIVALLLEVDNNDGKATFIELSREFLIKTDGMLLLLLFRLA